MTDFPACIACELKLFGGWYDELTLQAEKMLKEIKFVCDVCQCDWKNLKMFSQVTELKTSLFDLKSLFVLNHYKVSQLVFSNSCY